METIRIVRLLLAMVEWLHWWCRLIWSFVCERSRIKRQHLSLCGQKNTFTMPFNNFSHPAICGVPDSPSESLSIFTVSICSFATHFTTELEHTFRLWISIELDDSLVSATIKYSPLTNVNCIRSSIRFCEFVNVLLFFCREKWRFAHNGFVLVQFCVCFRRSFLSSRFAHFFSLQSFSFHVILSAVAWYLWHLILFILSSIQFWMCRIFGSSRNFGGHATCHHLSEK